MSTSSSITLKSGTSLGKFLDDVISEGIKSAMTQVALREKEKQAQAGSQLSQDNSGGEDNGDTDLFGDDDSEGGSETEQETTSSKTIDDETEKLKQGNVEPGDIVDKLNTIRSGKSFKDDAISSAMEEYVGSLSKAEKTALLAFLKGIAQIVTGEIAGKQAIEPSTNPADVAMKKGDNKEQKTKHVEPNVINVSMPKQKPSSGTEDASGPVPITPKRK